MRIGHGYDVHRFAKGRKLMLCGVEVDYELGLLGHSDADAALHALADSILGALALGDIGKLFPDSDPRYAGISSLALLEQVATQLKAGGWAVVNIDAKFCPSCGAKMPEAKQEEPEDAQKAPRAEYCPGCGALRRRTG